MWCFRRSDTLDATEGMSKFGGWSGGKPRSRRFSGTNVLPRVGVPWRSHGASGRLGGYWGLSGSYERVVRVDESRSGTGEMGVRAVLRTGLREGSGGDARVALGYVQKGFPSRPYRGVLGGVRKGLRNLTGDLTEPLTSCLTGYLPRGLTKAGVREVQAGSGGQAEGVSALSLRSRQHFGDHAVMDADPLGDHGFPALGLRESEDASHRAGIRPKPLGLHDALG